jgi:hypothetical protein
MQRWLLPTLWEILASKQKTSQFTLTKSETKSETKSDLAQPNNAEQQWQVAIASLQLLLQRHSLQPLGKTPPDKTQGVIFTAPVPILSEPNLAIAFPTAIFSSEVLNPFAWMPLQLPGRAEQSDQPKPQYNLSFLPGDPLSAEQFCLIFTPEFSLIIVLGTNELGEKSLLFSFDPEDTQNCWSALKPRILLASPHQLKSLEKLVQKYPAPSPSYKVIMEFTQQIMGLIPIPNPVSIAIPPPELVVPKVDYSSPYTELENPYKQQQDVELLQALTHEVRTPLATIRTMTRLILKSKDLSPEVSRRLEMIDAECTEQINRMELIFKATELETQPLKDQPLNLTAMSLSQILHSSIPRWQKQAAKYNLTLDVVVPQKLPNVVSNPAMLDQVLSGLIENFTRTLNSGSHIQMEVNLAGDRLKMQVQYHNDANKDSVLNPLGFTPNFKSLGQLLMLQPETGSLSLNLNVTKNLFQALGGKLIVRQRPEQGEVMTIFLPLHFN